MTLGLSAVKARSSMGFWKRSKENMRAGDGSSLKNWILQIMLWDTTVPILPIAFPRRSTSQGLVTDADDYRSPFPHLNPIPTHQILK